MLHVLSFVICLHKFIGLLDPIAKCHKAPSAAYEGGRTRGECCSTDDGGADDLEAEANDFEPVALAGRVDVVDRVAAGVGVPITTSRVAHEAEAVLLGEAALLGVVPALAELGKPGRRVVDTAGVADKVTGAEARLVGGGGVAVRVVLVGGGEGAVGLDDRRGAAEGVEDERGVGAVDARPGSVKRTV